MSATSIEWTDYTINPGVYGCSKASPACQHCYAMGMARRLGAMGSPGYQGVTDDRGEWTGAVRVDYDRIARAFASLPRRKRAFVFVTSMADLFHAQVPDEFIAAVYGEMAARAHLTFLVLTKRAERMARWYEWISDQLPSQHTHGAARGVRWYSRQWTRGRGLARASYIGNPGWSWPLPNVWAGVTVEDQKRASRLRWLQKVPAAVRFVSAEPLLSSLDIHEYLHPIGGERPVSWVICGGESGRHARPMHPDWTRSLRDQCSTAGVPYLHKQAGEWSNKGPLSARQAVVCGECGWWCDWGTSRQEIRAHHSETGHHGSYQLMCRVGKKAAGRLLDGVEHNGRPPC